MWFCADFLKISLTILKISNEWLTTFLATSSYGSCSVDTVVVSLGTLEVDELIDCWVEADALFGAEVCVLAVLLVTKLKLWATDVTTQQYNADIESCDNWWIFCTLNGSIIGSCSTQRMLLMSISICFKHCFTFCASPCVCGRWRDFCWSSKSVSYLSVYVGDTIGIALMLHLSKTSLAVNDLSRSKTSFLKSS